MTSYLYIIFLVEVLLHLGVHSYIHDEIPMYFDLNLKSNKTNSLPTTPCCGNLERRWKKFVCSHTIYLAHKYQRTGESYTVKLPIIRRYDKLHLRTSNMPIPRLEWRQLILSYFSIWMSQSPEFSYKRFQS